jgi:hypothetical protein
VISSVAITSHLPSGAKGSSSDRITLAVQEAFALGAALAKLALTDNAAAAMKNFMSFLVGCVAFKIISHEIACGSEQNQAPL